MTQAPRIPLDPAGDDRPAEPPATPAEAAYFAWLERRRAGAGESFTACCAAQPELADELAQLHAAWQAVDFRLAGAVQPPGAQPSAGVPPAGLEHRDPAQRYRPIETIARGGMGTVLHVWDQVLRRKLAMKVARTAPTADGGLRPSDAALGRFLEEAQITGQLDHPGIVPVHDLGLDADGCPFFTMRLVQGRDLRQVFRLARAQAQGWNLTRAVRALHQVCQTVAYAHARGVLHRDLKPANVMVGSFGETYVMDWGLAKVLERELVAAAVEPAGTVPRPRAAAEVPGRTLDGTVVGTPCYMAPEQAYGRVEQVGPRSDVYAVGAMLYELLSGQMPYSPSGAHTTPEAVLRLVREGPPRPVLELDPRASPELVAICAKAMARAPGARYGSMIDLGEDLQAWLDGRVVRAYESGIWAALSKWVGRNRGLAAVSAVAVVGLFASLIAFAAAQQRAAAVLERENYVLDLTAAEGALTREDSGAAAPHLERVPAARRGWEWQHLHSRLDRSTRRIAAHEEQVRAVAVSPDGTRLASVSWDRTVKLWDAASGARVHELAGHQGFVLCADFDPSGARLATGSYDQTVRLWRVADGAPLGAPLRHPAQVAAVAFAPAGEWLATGGYDGVVRLFAAGADAAAMEWHGHQRYVYGLAWAPSGRELASVSWDRSVRIWDLAQRRERAVLQAPEGHDDRVWSVAWSRDGRYLATGAEDGEVILWEAESAQPLWRSPLHDRIVAGLAFSPDGTLLATASWDKHIQLLEVPSGRPLALLNGHQRAVWSLAFAPDGAALYSASGDGTLRVWDPRTRGQSVPVYQADAAHEWAYALAFRPDDRQVAVGYQDGTIHLWDPAGGAPPLRWRAHQGRIFDLGYSADGRWLVTAAADGELHLYEVEDLEPGGAPEPAARIAGHGNQTPFTLPSFFALHPHAPEFAMASGERSAVVLALPSGRELLRLEGHSGPVLSAAYSPDGACVATTSLDLSARVWDARQGTLRHELRGHTLPVTAVAFAPDGARLVTTSWDGSARLWDARHGRLVAVLEGHQAYVTCVAYHPDGRRIVTGSLDSNLCLFDGADGRRLLTLHGHDNAVAAVRFSHDGRLLASCSADRSLRLWGTAPFRNP